MAKKSVPSAPKKEKVILLYSGGLDTSVIVHWLAQKNYDVICVIIDVGQQDADALAIQATRLPAQRFGHEFDSGQKATKRQALPRGVFHHDVRRPGAGLFDDGREHAGRAVFGLHQILLRHHLVTQPARQGGLPCS